MTGICHTQLLQSVALIEWDHMLLAGKDQALPSLAFCCRYHFLHKPGSKPLMAVFLNYIKPENTLIFSLWVMEGAVLKHLVYDRFPVCHSPVNKAYDPACPATKKLSGKASILALRLFSSAASAAGKHCASVITTPARSEGFTFLISIVSIIISILCLSSLYPKVIANSPFCMYISWVAGAWLNLLAKTSYMYIHCAHITVFHCLITPYVG